MSKQTQANSKFWRSRAEAAEAQVKALLEALPGERAEEMQFSCLAHHMIGAADNLRAYAAAAKPKERQRDGLHN